MFVFQCTIKTSCKYRYGSCFGVEQAQLFLVLFQPSLSLLSSSGGLSRQWRGSKFGPSSCYCSCVSGSLVALWKQLNVLLAVTII